METESYTSCVRDQVLAGSPVGDESLGCHSIQVESDELGFGKPDRPYGLPAVAYGQFCLHVCPTDSQHPKSCRSSFESYCLLMTHPCKTLITRETLLCPGPGVFPYDWSPG